MYESIICERKWSVKIMIFIISRSPIERVSHKKWRFTEDGVSQKMAFHKRWRFTKQQLSTTRYPVQILTDNQAASASVYFRRDDLSLFIRNF